MSNSSAKSRLSIPGNRLTLRENMVIVIQTNLMTADEKMGLQFGEILVVKKNGCERLNAYPRQWVTCKG
jgi:Xaa-Pro aminopeptidase